MNRENKSIVTIEWTKYCYEDTGKLAGYEAEGAYYTTES